MFLLFIGVSYLRKYREKSKDVIPAVVMKGNLGILKLSNTGLEKDKVAIQAKIRTMLKT
jgi:hypothetical protein